MGKKSKRPKRKHRPEQKLENEFLKFGSDRMMVVYPSVALALHRYYHWGRQKIIDMFVKSEEYWYECIDKDISPILVCQQETGFDFKYAEDKDFEAVRKFGRDKFKHKNWVALQMAEDMSRRKWMDAQLISIVCLVLYRDGSRIDPENLLKRINDVRSYYIPEVQKYMLPEVAKKELNINTDLMVKYGIRKMVEMENEHETQKGTEEISQGTTERNTGTGCSGKA